DLYAVFAKPYRRYLDAIGRKDILVVPIPGIDEFQKYAKQLLQIHRNIIHPEKLVLPQKPVIYILLEAVDMYEVREEFWTNYIDHILKKINSPKDHHFILKLHPMHSKHSLVKTENYFRKLGLEFSVLGDEIMSSASAEVVFSHYADHTTDVFCLFSSSCFYLSQLYSDKGIRFWYSTNFFMDYIENAPPQYHKLYVEIKPILDNVMAEKCSSY
ncbi:MAG TPA: hypothetical protein VL651_01595, partial [Bacteroidia bacterium]|nr:hypothetical protein [Bacteroidia bacterium]